MVALTMIITTGATPFSPQNADEIPDADLSIQPADGPNGVFAVINEDDEIEVQLTEDNPRTDIEGVQDDTVTTLDEVFTVTYTGEQYSRVWITDDIDAVYFYNETNSANPIDRQETGVVLAPNESIRVGLFVNTKGNNNVASIENFRIHAETADPGNENPSVDPDTSSLTPPDADTTTPTEVKTPLDGNETVTNNGGTGPEAAVPPEDTEATENGATGTEERGSELPHAGRMDGVGVLVVLILVIATLGLVRRYG